MATATVEKKVTYIYRIGYTLITKVGCSPIHSGSIYVERDHEIYSNDDLDEVYEELNKKVDIPENARLCIRSVFQYRKF